MPAGVGGGLLGLLAVVGQDVAGALQQVVAEEEAPEGVLHAAAHLHQVLQDVLARLREGAHVDHAHRDQQVAAPPHTQIKQRQLSTISTQMEQQHVIIPFLFVCIENKSTFPITLP